MNARILPIFVLGLVVGRSSAVAAQQSFTEDFSTDFYKDSVHTTADWNTAVGELALFPFSISGVGSYDTPGSAFGVAVSGDLAFVADNPDVLILDIGDPTSPILLGSFAAGDAQAVHWQGDLLYVAAGVAGLTIVDISDPTTPTLIGNLNTPSVTVDVVVEGDVAYVADSFNGLIVVDVSDPTTPVQIGLYDTPNQARGVDVSGDYCYVADRGNSGIIVLDVSDPTTPTFAGGVVLPADTWNVDVDGDLAYVSETGAGLAILDITDPTNPTVVATLDPGAVRDAVVSGDVVYAAGNTAVHAIDVSNPMNPFVIESWENPGIASGIAVAGEHAFVADGTVGGLQVLEIREPMSPLPIGSTATPGDAHDVVVAGDFAYVAADHAGLQVLDISSPTSPALVGSCATPGDIWQLTVAGNIALALENGGEVHVIDIRDPTMPTLLSGLTLPGIVRDAAVTGDLAFVANDVSGLQVIDLSDPTVPIIIGNLPTPSSARSVALAGDLAVVVGFSVSLVDIHDPTAPTLVGILPLTDAADDVCIEGDLALVAAWSGGLRLIDISDPTTPVLVGTHDTVGLALGVEVAGDLALVAEHSGGFEAIDISDPTLPTLVGGKDTADKAYDLAVAGPFAYVAEGAAGLRVLQVFQSERDSDRNQGQSLALTGGGGSILRVRLTTSASADVSWEVAADGGSLWFPIGPGIWTAMPVPSDQLVWRSTHVLTNPLVNPTADDLTLEWRNEAAFPSAVEDVPDDQGGWVRVHFTRSGYDFAEETGYPATGYQIYQRADSGTASRVAKLGTPLATGDLAHEALAGVDIAAQRRLGERRFVSGGSATAGTFPPGTWEAVAWVAATQSDTYTARVSTTADSTITGTEWSVYLVTTHTTVPSVWFVSEPDSGYSIDNLAPGVPEALTVAYNTGSGNTLSWNAAPEPDFQFYRVYRSSDPNFIPTPSDLVGETATPGWIDPDYDGGAVYYQVTALDVAGNESDPAMAGSVTAVSLPATPVLWALHGNAPNPFHPSTTIQYDVPTGNVRVEILVFDAAGRRVRTLVDDSVSAGRHEVRWDARDDRGQAVASGMYFYRMRSGSFAEMRKMLLLR